MSADRIEYLIRQHASNQASAEETEELFGWLRENGSDEELQLQLELLAASAEPVKHYTPDRWEPYIQQVLQTKPVQVRSVSGRWWKYAAAAAILALVGGLVFMLNRKQEPKQTLATNTKPAAPVVVQPGRNGAMLTLSDGRQMMLDSAGNGLLATQGRTAIVIKNGKLVYDVTEKSQEVFTNTMSTPRGRTYQMVLPDGTLVWLNAASSITYPTAFADNNRTVSITGEVYFEVAKSKSKPFRVKVGNMDVDVLGTSFNINSYFEEADIKTTLLEGAVLVAANGKSSLLKPGQQAVSGGKGIEVTRADIDQVMAWKKGLFNFDRMKLPTILNQIARWYDVEVRYEGAIPEGRFRGKVNRDMNLDLVLQVLKDVGVKFRMEGKVLVVTN